MVDGQGAKLMKILRKECKERGITICAYCKDQFSNVLPAKEKERIKDLTEFVDERTT